MYVFIYYHEPEKALGTCILFFLAMPAAQG